MVTADVAFFGHDLIKNAPGVFYGVCISLWWIYTTSDFSVAELWIPVVCVCVHSMDY